MFKDKLRKLRKESGFSMDDLCNAYNKKFNGKMNKSTLSRYENGIQTPMFTVVKNLAGLFNVPIDYLSSDKDYNKIKCDFQESFLQSDELFILSDYNALNGKGKEEASKRIHELTEIPRYINTPTANKVNPYDVNLYDLPVSAGTGMYLSDDTKETIQIKRTPEALKSDFALTVRGNSMEPKFFDNDIILIKSMPCIEVGAIGIFVINGDAFLKKFGGDRLISLNESYKDIIFTSEDTICCLGLVVGKAERI